jgi:hypothetical protein
MSDENQTDPVEGLRADAEEPTGHEDVQHSDGESDQDDADFGHQ